MLGFSIAMLTHRAWGARALRVAVLRSAASARVQGWMGAAETDGSIAALRALGLDVGVLSDDDLSAGKLDGVDLLVVPNARCVPRAAARVVADWVKRGGRLLATGLAAYRDEDNKLVGTRNNFQWADLYGADFQRWLGAWPHCEYLVLDPALAREVGALLDGRPRERVELGRNTAMLVRPRASSSVLATWLEADGKTPGTDSGSASAAIVQDDRVIYVGENLLAPELSRSPEVMALVLALVRRLDADAPARLPAGLAQEPSGFAFPEGPRTVVPTGGPPIRVGIHSALAVAGLASGAPLTLKTTDATGSTQTLTVKVGQSVRVTAGVGHQAGANPAIFPDVVVELQRHPQDWLTVPALKVEVTSTEPQTAVDLLALRPNGTCKAEAFDGRLEFTPGEHGMNVVNVIDLERYTAGVVPNETPAVYPPAALQSMAVIARTFALSRIGYHKDRGYDVCNTVDCQMYGGVLTEWDNANDAVNATRGQVIRYNGRYAYSTFHAVCGGSEDSVEDVWPDPPCPYLVAEPDGPAPLPDLSSEAAFRNFIDHPPESYCQTSPRFRWRETYTLAQLQALFERSLPISLGAAYHGLGTLRGVTVLSRCPHGRVQTLRIEGTEGVYEVHKDRIRWLWSGGVVGQGGLQSTLFYVQPRPDGALDFVGGGWGHGVGMCQEGAAGMASRGLDYRAIILHYYPHTTIETNERT